MEEVKFFPPPPQAGSEEMPHQTQAQMSGLGSGFQERDRFYFFKDYCWGKSDVGSWGCRAKSLEGRLGWQWGHGELRPCISFSRKQPWTKAQGDAMLLERQKFWLRMPVFDNSGNEGEEEVKEFYFWEKKATLESGMGMWRGRGGRLGYLS